MGALAHHIEAAGVATTGISLIREHTEVIKPPRALWVPFELGRPFGPPRNREFQTDVLKAALDLFKRESGPVLEDYPHESPDIAPEDEAWACVLPLPALEDAGSAAEKAKQLVQAELARLRPWYDEARAETRRTAFGLSGLEPESAEVMAAFLAVYAAGESAAPPEGVAEPMPAALRVVADDLKSFYLEAAAAQPGGRVPGSQELNRWLYHDTKLGSLFYDLRDRLAAETPEGQRPPGIIPNVFARRPE